MEWLAKQNMAAATIEKATWTFEQLLFPEIGERPIRHITAAELLAALRKLEARGKIETAHRTKQRASQIFRYAIATGRAERDPLPTCAAPSLRSKLSTAPPSQSQSESANYCGP